MTRTDRGPYQSFAAEFLPRVEQALEALLPPGDEAPVSLHRAMRHAMFPGGKRLRPMLALVAARVLGDGELDHVLAPAAALECMHTYSLVHDDLPCMDDDDLRRGRPTCHKAFGEALAVLAGDALQAIAFEGVAAAGAAAVGVLARASGSRGMVGGQVGDIEAESKSPGIEQVRWIHDRKTGALIAASLEIGALAVAASDEALAAIRGYGKVLGRAFQIADDCLDLTGDAAALGKRPGQDVSQQKATYPAALGLEASQLEAARLSQEAAAMAPRICALSRNGTVLDGDIRLLEDTALYFTARNR